MLLPILRRKIDAKGSTILIKFFDGTWYCVGYQRPNSCHLSRRLARDHVIHTWRNFILKSIDHNGVLEIEDFIESVSPIKKAVMTVIRDAWQPPTLPAEEPEPSKPAWLPEGKCK